MTYSDLILRLFNVNQTAGIKFGLDNMRSLSEALGHPERTFKSIHVAGTNGKGSVTTKIASGLHHEGYKVGLYTSPHISCFRERIQVNGKMIPEKKVVEHLKNIFQIMDALSIPATFFEITTILAFLHFSESKVHYSVIETGLGGRLDATNIIMPELSIITSISQDHTEILGKSIYKIAKEKAGIIKKNTPVLIGPRVPYKVIEEAAIEKRSKLRRLPGKYLDFNLENCSIAKAALEFLGVGQSSINKGLNAIPPCRLQLVPNLLNFAQYPEAVILDVGHNPNGLTRMFKAINQKYPQKSLRAVCGLSKNKDVESCLAVLEKNAHDFHLVHATNGRGQPSDELSSAFLSHGVPSHNLHVDGTITDSVVKAIQLAYESKQILVICGTFFIMSEARAALGIVEPRDNLNLN